MASDDRDIRATIVTTASQLPTPAKTDAGTACLVVIYGAELGRRIPLVGEQLVLALHLGTGAVVGERGTCGLVVVLRRVVGHGRNLLAGA